jgi:hypothetical protein
MVQNEENKWRKKASFLRAGRLVRDYLMPERRDFTFFVPILLGLFAAIPEHRNSATAAPKVRMGNACDAWPTRI